MTANGIVKTDVTSVTMHLALGVLCVYSSTDYKCINYSLIIFNHTLTNIIYFLIILKC